MNTAYYPDSYKCGVPGIGQSGEHSMLIVFRRTFNANSI